MLTYLVPLSYRSKYVPFARKTGLLSVAGGWPAEKQGWVSATEDRVSDTAVGGRSTK